MSGMHHGKDEKHSLIKKHDEEIPVERKHKFIIRPRFAYRSGVLQPNSFVYLSNNHVALPVGRHIWKYNIKEKEMIFLARRSKQVNQKPPSEPYLCVSKNRKRLLTAETVNDVVKRSVMRVTDITHKTPTLLWKFNHKGIVTSADISEDGEVIAVYIKYCEHESKTAHGYLALWKTGTKKPVALKEMTTPVNHVTICPEDNYYLCVSGANYMRFLRCGLNNVDEERACRRHNEKAFTFTKQTWMSVDTMICLTQEGVICVFEKSDSKSYLKQKITPEDTKKSINSLSSLDRKTTGTADYVNEEDDTDDESKQLVKPCCVLGYPNKFIIGTENGTLCFYEKSNNNPDNSGGSEYTLVKEIDIGIRAAITDLSMSPSRESILLTVPGHALFEFPLGQFSTNMEQDLPCVPVFIPCGNTVAIATSVQHDFMILIDDHKTLRMYQGIRDSKQISQVSHTHVFEQQPKAMALHPNGYALVVAFTKHFGVYHLMRTGLKLSHSFPQLIPTADKVILKYSNRADRIAISTGSNLFIFNSLDYSLRQHIPVSSVFACLTWSTNDSLLTCSLTDGSVYCYEVNNLSRVQDFADKTCVFSSLVVDWGRKWEWEDELTSPIRKAHQLISHSNETIGEDSKDEQNGGNDSNENNLESHGIVIAAGVNEHVPGKNKLLMLCKDGMTRELKLLLDNRDETSSETAVELPKTQITCMQLDSSRGVLVAGTAEGCILLIRWPPVETEIVKGLPGREALVYVRYYQHFGAVVALELDRQTGALYSHGEDGSLFVMDLGLITKHGFQTMSSHPDKPQSDNEYGVVLNTAHLRNWTEYIYKGDPDLVMVRRTELEKTLVAQDNHKQRMAQLKTQTEYQLRTARERYDEQLSILRSDMEEAIQKKNNEVEKHKGLVHQLSTAARISEQEQDEVIRKHENKLRTDYDARLDAKDRRIEALTVGMEQERDNMLASEQEQARAYEARIQELEDSLHDRAQQYQNHLQELQKNNEDIEKNYEEVVWQTEMEHDAEVINVQKKNEEELSRTKRGTSMVLAQMSGLKNQGSELSKELSLVKIKMQETQEELERRQAMNVTLKEQVTTLLKQTKHKEVLLFEKQQELASTRQASSVLHNFATLLENRISEMEEKEGPSREYAKQMKETMKGMHEEIFKLASEGNRLTHQVKVKNTDNDRLNTTIKKLRADLTRQSKRWQTIVREMQHIVEHTPSNQWPNAIQFFYSAHIASSVKPGETNTQEREVHNRVFAVLDRQRRHLEHSLENMKSTLGVLEKRRQSEAERFIQRNTLFLAEVNQLREQNRKLEQRCKKYMRMALVSNEMSKRLAVPDSSTKKNRKNLLNDTKSENNSNSNSPAKLTYEKNELAPNEGEQLWTHRPRTGARKNGTVMRGSTRPLSAVAGLKRQLNDSREALEAAQTTVELQKLEISHLQEGVTVALDLAQTNFASYSASLSPHQQQKQQPHPEQIGLTTPGRNGGNAAHEIDFTLSPNNLNNSFPGNSYSPISTIPLRPHTTGSPSLRQKSKSRPITPGFGGKNSNFGIPEHSQTPPGLGQHSRSKQSGHASSGKRNLRVSQSAQSLGVRTLQGLSHSPSAALLPVPKSFASAGSVGTGAANLNSPSGSAAGTPSKSQNHSVASSPMNKTTSLKMTTLYSGKRSVV